MNELFLVDLKHKLKANQDIFRAKTVRVLVGMIDHLTEQNAEKDKRIYELRDMLAAKRELQS